MANLTAANVRVVAEWVEGELYSKRRIAKRVEVFNLSDIGPSTPFVASAFGLRVVEEVTPAYDAAAGYALLLVPNPSGSEIAVFGDVADDSMANDFNVSNTPNGLYFTVKGY